MYKTYYRLAIRDTKNFNKWQHSKQYPSMEALMKACFQWLKDNPNRIVSFQTCRVFIPEQAK